MGQQILSSSFATIWILSTKHSPIFESMCYSKTFKSKVLEIKFLCIYQSCFLTCSKWLKTCKYLLKIERIIQMPKRGSGRSWVCPFLPLKTNQISCQSCWKKDPWMKETTTLNTSNNSKVKLFTGFLTSTSSSKVDFTVKELWRMILNFGVGWQRKSLWG